MGLVPHRLGVNYGILSPAGTLPHLETAFGLRESPAVRPLVFAPLPERMNLFQRAMNTFAAAAINVSSISLFF